MHATAIVHPTASLDGTVVIGPYCIVGPRCIVGAGTRLEAFVHLKEDVTLGMHNILHTGVVLGDAPQHTKYAGHLGRIIAGDGNTFREHFTAHKPFDPGGATRIGNGCFFMAGSHLGHDVHVGDRVILANCTAMGGHAVIGDDANISAFVGVHQFGRVGRLAMIGGVSRVSRDVPPFCLAVEGRLRGLNTIGMKRSGISQKARSQVKSLFKTLFAERHAFSTGLVAARRVLEEWGENATPEAVYFMAFVECPSRRPIMKYLDSPGAED